MSHQLPSSHPPAGDPVSTADTRIETQPVVFAENSDFASFYSQSWHQVARGLAATLGDQALAGEATDEAMARAYQNWSKISTYEFPAGWAYRVGLNWARSYHRRLARALPLRRAETAELAPVEDPAIRKALLDLDPKHRSVVVCRLLLDWSIEQTAAALEISPGTVKSRQSRAVAILESTLSHLRDQS